MIRTMFAALLALWCGCDEVTARDTYELLTSSSPVSGGVVAADIADLNKATVAAILSYNCYPSDVLKIELTATPNPGWRFDHWDGDCSGTDPTITVTFMPNPACHESKKPSVIAEQSCTAVFVELGDGGVPDLGGKPMVDMAQGGCGDMACIALPATNHDTKVKPTKQLLLGGVAHDDYIIVSNGGFLGTSTDGITWTQGSFGGMLAGYDYVGVAAGATAANKYVAVAGGGAGGPVVYSPDAKSWTQATGPQQAADVTWDGKRYVTAGNSGEICTSSDGAAWSCNTVAALAMSYPRRIIYTGSSYVLVGASQTGSFAATSPDAATWTVQSTAATKNAISAVAFANGLLVACTWTGAGGADVITSSDGGKTWVANASAKAALVSPNANLAGVGWTGQWWVIAGDSSNLLVSMDGMTWQDDDSPTNAKVLGMTTAGPRGAVVLLANGWVFTVEK
jgi:hypothetical protein